MVGNKIIRNVVVLFFFITIVACSEQKKKRVVNFPKTDLASENLIPMPLKIIPTKKGFIYGTLEVIETKYDSLNNDYDLPNDAYELSSSVTKPIFFKNKENINKFVSLQKPTFKDV